VHGTAPLARQRPRPSADLADLADPADHQADNDLAF
jgi:hypothetical protein